MSSPVPSSGLPPCWKTIAVSDQALRKFLLSPFHKGVPAAQWAYHSALVEASRRVRAPQGLKKLPLLQTTVISYARVCVCVRRVYLRAKPTAASWLTRVLSSDLEAEQILIAPLL